MKAEKPRKEKNKGQERCVRQLRGEPDEGDSPDEAVPCYRIIRANHLASLSVDETRNLHARLRSRQGAADPN